MDSVVTQIEEKVILYTSLLIAAMTLIAAFINVFLKLEPTLIVLVFFISSIYFSIFLYLKFYPLNQFIKYFITIFSMVLINLTWYFNYFSYGPSLGFFILIYAFMIFIWDKKHSIIFSIAILLNLFGLMFYEYHFYQVLERYSSERTRIFDVYFGGSLVLGVIHFFTSYLKVNYVKQYKNAKKSDELKTSFLANLSHEIRTPLNSIIGFSDLITSDDISTQDRKLFNSIIQNNSNDLLALIEDVVDLALIESDEIKLVKTEFDLNKLLESIYIEYTQTFKLNKPIEIRHQKLNPSITVFTDQLRVRQIIKNLFNNAIKYTDAGIISIGFDLTATDAVFHITDTGKGIKKEDQEIIFNRFLKLENKSELYRGVGIGLHLSKRIAKILGGDIWVDSTYGKGSTFYFNLPLQPQKSL